MRRLALVTSPRRRGRGRAAAVDSSDVFELLVPLLIGAASLVLLAQPRTIRPAG